MSGIIRDTRDYDVQTCEKSCIDLFEVCIANRLLNFNLLEFLLYLETERRFPDTFFASGVIKTGFLLLHKQKLPCIQLGCQLQDVLDCDQQAVKQISAHSFSLIR